jgi:hypothetical protein
VLVDLAVRLLAHLLVTAGLVAVHHRLVVTSKPLAVVVVGFISKAVVAVAALEVVEVEILAETL